MVTESGSATSGFDAKLYECGRLQYASGITPWWFDPDCNRRLPSPKRDWKLLYSARNEYFEALPSLDMDFPRRTYGMLPSLTVE